MSNNKAKRGAPSIFERKDKLLKALKGIKGYEGYAEPSYYHKRLLAEEGYVGFVTVKQAGRGRPRHNTKLTPKGQAIINFAR
jgi:hypothetical protein